MSLESLIQWDQQASLWLNKLGNATWDPFWLMLSDTRFWFPAYGIIMLFLFRELGWKKGLAVLLSIIVMLVTVDQSCNGFKAGLERLRPCYNAWMIAHDIRLPYGVTGHLFGFFSAHAANTFGFAATSFLGFQLNRPKRSYCVYGWCVFIWAALVAYSRIMMGAHFLGDVLVGACYGLAVGSAIACLTHYLIVKARL